MRYSLEDIQKLMEGADRTSAQLKQLQLDCVKACHGIQDERVREYMLHGVGRRLNVLRHTIKNIFDIFPPYTQEKLNRDVVVDVQINLHAFFINLIGVFDNFAWSFVHRHQAENEVGGRLNVDMFKERTRRILPQALRQHLSSEEMTRWHSEYLKNYRDALAHRIPMYIPPASITPSENDRYNELEAQRITLIQQGNWGKLDEITTEQDAIGSPCFTFLHSYTEDASPRPMLIHPQLLSDALTVIEFSNLFLAHWHDRA